MSGVLSRDIDRAQQIGMHYSKLYVSLDQKSNDYLEGIVNGYQGNFLKGLLRNMFEGWNEPRLRYNYAKKILNERSGSE